jgi:predicted lactoylglutathione lyase
MANFISHVATVEIPVTNLKKSIEFYIDILGVETDFKGKTSSMLTFQKKGVPTIFLVETEEFEGLSFRNTNNEIVHSVIDFYTPSLKDFYNWLKEKKVEVGTLNVNNENGLGGFGFKDPDGNLLGATNVLHFGQ